MSLLDRARREPFGAALIAVNIALAAALVYRKLSSSPRSLPPGHPDVSVPADLASRAAAPAGETFALNGVVRLGPGMKWPSGAYVFVIARGEGGGPPYAVRRYENATMPLAWSLGPDNVMIAGMPRPERLSLTARADQDGNPMTRQLGDLESAPTAPASQGAIELILDREAPLGQ